jgi:hypothetical protein
MGNLHLRRVELPACPNLSKCNDNLPFTKGRQHGPNPAGGGLIGKIPWNLLEKRIEASFGGNSSHLNLTALPSVPIAIAQTAGSLQEIHYLCVFAPLRLCVLFFQTAGISAGDPLRAVLSPEGWYILCRGRRPRLPGA